MSSSRSIQPSTSPTTSQQHTPPTLLVTSPTTDILPPSTSTPPPHSTTSSRSTSGTMTHPPPTAANTPPCAHHSSPEQRTSATPSSHTTADEECQACILDRPYIARIRSPSHLLLATHLLFTDPQRLHSLFTNFIHVPLGITSLLLLTWLIKQAMDKAPFRFPSPVLAMLLLFLLLLSLDFLSTTKPVQKFAQRRGRGRGKVLLEPMLVVLEAPCDFCLRYMSVMFTPSFILIPAREMIGGREIGLITGWFAASQVLALVFPVVLHRVIRCGVEWTKKRYGDKEEKSRREDEQWRASVATLVAVMSNINAVSSSTRQKLDISSSAPVEKHMVGGEKLGSIATGLSGMTAIATAPLTLNTTPPSQQRQTSQQDAQRQLEHVQLETARQQGDPYATSHTPLPEHHHHYPLPSLSAPNSPSLQHNHRLHHAGYFARGRAAERPELGRSRSLARSWVGSAKERRAKGEGSMSPGRVVRPRSGGAGVGGGGGRKGRVGAVVVGRGSGLRFESQRRPQSASVASGRFAREGEEGEGTSPTFDEYIFRARQDLIDRRSSAVQVENEVDPRGEELETLVMPTLVPTTPTRSSHDEVHEGKVVLKTMDIKAQPLPELNTEKKPSTSTHDLEGNSEPHLTPQPPVQQEPEMDAIDRLVEHLWNSIPWLVFTLLLLIGIPLFYLLDISLPLFLSINLLTFLASITLVPPPIRRYLHPILTTSITTVLLLWAIGAVRSWPLKRTLSSYSVDAKYTVLWSPSGYTGPVIGAGDVLFSTLDAGIVSLAIPMYRYRWDLWFHLVDMLVVLMPCSMLSLFVWPTVASRVGIEEERALAFASRFMSTPLAIELSLTIGADESLTVVLVVITGILISIFKDPFFRLFGLNPDQDGPNNDDGEGEEGEKGGKDYLTIGIAMGSTAGAIGASSLISKPRSMAIASLSFVLFGAILLIFAAIPPIVDTLRTLTNAPLEFTPASS